MKTNRLILWSVLALALLGLGVFGLASCGLAGNGSAAGVELRFTNQEAKSLLPPISMSVTEYIVTGSGPSGKTFGPQLFTGDASITDLLPGAWHFNVVGRNAAHNDIGEGSGDPVIIIGQTTVCAITVAEYSGAGSLALALAWEPDIVDNPIWTGSLKDFGGTTLPMAFNVNAPACTATSVTDPVPVGWHTMIVKLFDAPSGLDGSEVLSTGAAVAVRIAANHPTAGDLFLHAVQGSGQLDLQIGLDFHDPLILTPNRAFGPDTIYSGQSHSYTVSADEACTTIFYLRGVQVGIDSYTVQASDLLEGETYRLDAIAFNASGTRAASGTWTLSTVVGIPVTSVTVDPATVHPPKNGESPYQVTAEVFPANASDKSIYWTTSNPAIATVEQQGATVAYIYGWAPGTAVVTVHTNYGNFTANVTVTVSP